MIRPGGIELTVIPYLPTSRDRPLAQAWTAALAENAALSRSGSDLPVMLMIRPQRRSIICGSRAWVIWRCRVKLSVIASSQLSSGASTGSGRLPPAQLTRMSTCAKPGERGIAQSYRRIPSCDVLGDQQRARSLAPFDLAGELFEKSSAASRCGDLNTFGGQSFCDRAADPHARPGNERSLSDKVQVHYFSSEMPGAKLTIMRAFAQAKSISRC